MTQLRIAVIAQKKNNIVYWKRQEDEEFLDMTAEKNKFPYKFRTIRLYKL